MMEGSQTDAITELRRTEQDVSPAHQREQMARPPPQSEADAANLDEEARAASRPTRRRRRKTIVL